MSGSDIARRFAIAARIARSTDGSGWAARGGPASAVKAPASVIVANARHRADPQPIPDVIPTGQQEVRVATFLEIEATISARVSARARARTASIAGPFGPNGA